MSDDDKLSSETFGSDEGITTDNLTNVSTTPSTTSTSELQSSPIRQTNSVEEFDQIVEEETESIFSLGESKKLDVGAFSIILILVLVVVVIVIFFAYSFLRKPKDFAKASSRKL